MTRWGFQLGLELVFGLGALAAAPAADDAKAKTETTPKPPVADRSKAPEFSGYVSVTKVTGEVMAADENSATIRLYWLAPAQQKRGARPHLHTTNRSALNPYTIRQPKVQVRWEHHDYELPFVPESLVRTKVLPQKFDGDGKKASYTEKELDDLKVPYSVPGYAASKSDLVKGTVVDAYVIRDRTIPADKVTEKDLKLRYLIIIGHDPNPPADGGSKPTKKN